MLQSLLRTVQVGPGSHAARLMYVTKVGTTSRHVALPSNPGFGYVVCFRPDGPQDSFLR